MEHDAGLPGRRPDYRTARENIAIIRYLIKLAEDVYEDGERAEADKYVLLAYDIIDRLDRCDEC